MDIATWLRGLGLERYAEAFRANEVTAEALPELTDADLRELGLPLGPRRILLKAIRDLTDSPLIAPARAQARAGAEAAVPGPKAERRQLTVLFCDLVGSTPLSQRLDPEEMREVLRSYQNAVMGEVMRFEGHVAKLMGDGVLGYFGWPRAHEDEAERAVQAGLAIAETVSRLSTPAREPLAARVGIATGLVVVGDLVGEGAAQEEAVVGATPNLAARLQEVATPGAVVIADGTRRLLGELFELCELGPTRLKGFARPVNAFRVLGERAAGSRFEARRAGRPPPIVGRDQELALVLERWRHAVAGEGQAVLLVGEAGIGKSRLVQATLDALAGGDHVVLRYQCSPLHTGTALWPVVQQLGVAAGLEPADTEAAKLDKLEALLRQGVESVGEAALLIAALLGMDAGARYAARDFTPQQRRARTLAVLIEQLLGLARRRSVLMVLEDAHWIDPTTLEFLCQALDRIAGARALMLLTSRPDNQPALGGHPHVTRLTLNRLSRGSTEAIVTHLTGGRSLPPGVLREIAARTDGVPLFIEELTKAVLETDGTGPGTAVPASLHASLMARLDRVPGVKEVAQVGACIGREFTYALLAAVSPFPKADLRAALDRLAAAELVFSRGVPPEASYTFKHALVRDAAHDSLLKAQRQQLHAHIASVLEQNFRETVGAEPELLAQHCTEAGLAERAVRYWWQAAQQAIQRAATLESIADLENGLNLLHMLPDSPEHVRLELDMQVALGTACMAAKGWSSPATVAAFARAEELCERVEDPLQRSVADYGRYLVYLLRGQVDAALATSTAMLSRAERDRDVATKMIAHRCVGVTSVHLGDFDSARRHMEMALALYDPKEHATLAYRFGYEPRITNLSYLAHALLQLGYRARALESYDQLMEEIRTHQHTPSVAFGLFQASLFCTFERDLGAYKLERDFGADDAIVDKLIAVCTEHGFSLWRTAGLIYKGWLMARSGEPDRGLAQMCEGITAWRGDAKAMVSRWLLLFASALGRLGQLQASLDTVEEGLALVTETNERWNEAELHLRKGELLLDFSLRDEAEASFQQALAVARHQRARIWELRAATSLARLWRDHGKRTEARDLLAPVNGWFTEGFDTKDLRDARALLDELGVVIHLIGA